MMIVQETPEGEVRVLMTKKEAQDLDEQFSWGDDYYHVGTMYELKVGLILLLRPEDVEG